jgi:2-polyprenyl-6-methoxyphenol hydroxylase-like FAD-dependent oxidoreductase
MPIKNICIMGGGPIGLFSAIEAKQQFQKAKVTVIEKRLDYTRLNIPSLENPIRRHLKSLDLIQQTIKDQTSGFAPLSTMEEALYGESRRRGREAEARLRDYRDHRVRQALERPIQDDAAEHCRMGQREKAAQDQGAL